MRRRLTHAFFAALAALSLSLAASAHGAETAAPSAYTPMQVKPVTTGVYVITGGGGNTTVRVGKDAVILVDTKYPGEPYLSDLLAKIRSITPLPVKYVFITHHHGDHSGNEGVFLANGSVIASEAEAATYRDYKTTKGVKAPPVNVAYSGRSIQVWVDGATAIGYHFGPGHTAGDTVVYFPDVKVVASGDLVADKTPNVDYVPGGGSILGWQRSLDDILALDFDYLITGHGEPVRLGNDPGIMPGAENTFQTYGHWARLSNTPFRLYKSWAHEGGIATPLIVSTQIAMQGSSISIWFARPK